MNISDVIPPKSIVRLVRSDETTPTWTGREGEKFQIGYYVPNDGLGVIWLVNTAGDYSETIDRETLLRCFQIEHLSTETDLFGEGGVD